jgi:hypothetical protein
MNVASALTRVMPGSLKVGLVFGAVLTSVGLTAETFPIAADGKLNASAYTLVPVQLAMGRKIPSAPTPKKRLSAPAVGPQGGLTSDERAKLAEVMKRMTPKERKRLAKMWKRMTPDERNQLAAIVKRNLAAQKPSNGPKRAM